jgi:hypothetical protein
MMTGWQSQHYVALTLWTSGEFGRGDRIYWKFPIYAALSIGRCWSSRRFRNLGSDGGDHDDLDRLRDRERHAAGLRHRSAALAVRSIQTTR